MKPDLGVNIGGIKMKNPVLTASGTFGFGLEYAGFVDLDSLGGITVKGTTLKPRLGNPTPRIAETPAGMLNSIGLQNPGVDRLISDTLPKLKGYDTAIVVNIAGETLEEYGALAERLSEAEGVAGLEVNISCPNVRKGGVLFGSDPKMAAAVIKEVKANSSLPVIAKLTPNVTKISEIAFACGEAGADGLSLINTLTGMAIDIHKRKPLLANIIGGLSGPAIRPVAVRAVWEVYKEVGLPIIGMGGIATTGDALEFILAGATGIAVGTANFVNPGTAMEIVAGINEYLSVNGIKTISDLVGVAHE